MPLAIALLTVLLAVSDTERLWAEYHAAGDAAGRAAAWSQLLASNPSFEDVVQRLKQRNHDGTVPTGLLSDSRVDLDGRVFRYKYLVPESYDASTAYPVRVVLHGSTRRPAWSDEEDHWRWTDPFRGEGAITVFPAAWDEAMWWSDRQVENLRAILDRLRARYHIDSNRCYLTGLSDGGTGTFYQALRSPTPWAAFTPLIGHPWVLGNREEGADGDIFAANLFGRSLFVVNGESDRLYPARALKPYLDLFRRAGAAIRFKTKPGGHNVRWWPEEAPAFARFRAENPRDPWPVQLVWETNSPQRNGRVHWIVIEEIGDAPAPDPDPLNTVLFPELDPPTRAEAFPRSRPSGKTEATRTGNRIELRTRNVRRLSILLGVDSFDFSKPLELTVNGREQTLVVEPSVDELMRWAIEDGDPALLVGAEVELSPARLEGP